MRPRRLLSMAAILLACGPLPPPASEGPSEPSITDTQYLPVRDEGGILLRSDASLELHASATATSIRLAGSEFRFGVTRCGRRDRTIELAAFTPIVRGGELRLGRAPGIEEWWRAGPDGLEHGVHLSERPSGAGPLELEVRIEGVVPRLLDDDRVALEDATSSERRVVASYSHLVVLDAQGTVVESRLDVRDGRIVIVVEDHDAVYPLEVDPLLATEDAVLRALDEAASNRLGSEVAFSADGTRLAVGVPSELARPGFGPGSVRIWRRSGASWIEEASLRVPNPSAQAIGGRLALSADGMRVLTGPDFGGDVAVHVFVRTGTAWAYEAAIPAPPDHFTFGMSLGLSGDGSRAIVGDGRNSVVASMAGAAYLFTRSGSSWSLETTLYAVDGEPNDWFGESAAISVDGERVLIAGPYHRVYGFSSAGQAYVYALRDGFWGVESVIRPRRPATGTLINAQFGRTLALAGDGTRALLRTPGGALIFARSGTASTGFTWRDEAMIAVADGVVAAALNTDGSRALGGAWFATNGGFTQAGSAFLSARVGTSWSAPLRIVPSDPATFDNFGRSVALTGAGTVGAFGVPGDDGPGASDVGSVRIFALPLFPNGDGCADDASCASGSCIDGVCCQSSCGGGSDTDCQACSAALTGGVDGTCAPLRAAVASTVTCRAAVSACDAPEQCTSSSVACPSDVVAPSGTSCRAVAGVCDRAEVCDGLSPTCPADGFTTSAVLCRPALSICDVAEFCSGAGPACPANAVGAAGVSCRAGTGPCDRDEVCDGSSPACPGDVLAPAGGLCRPAAGPCDASEVCDGRSAACPDDGLRALGEVCLPADAGNPCDAPDVCDGALAGCASRYAPPSTVCRPSSGAACDAPDRCAGTSATCVAQFLSGVECRASSGPCDRAEVCAGASEVCPPDSVSPASVSCRTSSDTDCDPEESCDGVSTSCPADISACEMPDAGPPSPDGGSGGSDAGPPIAAAGCSASRLRSVTGPPVAWLGLLALGWIRRRPRGCCTMLRPRDAPR